MNEIYCFGLNFFAKCPETHLNDHFLFNLETAVSSLAIVVAIYALLLEKRFRVRIQIKRSQLKKIIYLTLSVLFFTFIGATLPYVSGEPRPIIGYPIFWEILAFFILLYCIFQAFDLMRSIKKLTKKQVKELIICAPYDTLIYHGLIDLMVKEADYFWEDFLKKTIVNDALREVLKHDFSGEDFLKVAVKSRYILLQTVSIIKKAKPETNIHHIEEYLRKLFILGVFIDDSIISHDLKSSYKDMTKYIMRENKMANIIFGNYRDLFLTSMDFKDQNRLGVLKRFLKIFELYLGRKYHYTEDDKKFTNLIEINTLENFLSFFKDSLMYLNSEEKTEFMRQLSFLTVQIKNLPEGESRVLSKGIYSILETYAQGKNWSKDLGVDRLYCIELELSFVDQNKYTRESFQQLLLEKIAGSKDPKKRTKIMYNLAGYYPMMTPVYFFIYGHALFSNQVPAKDFKFNMAILRKMQKNLPKIADGEIINNKDNNSQGDERILNAMNQRIENCLNAMFPDNVIYNKDENSLTHYFSGNQSSSTLLLNETVQKNEFVFKKK
ncbi:hypothetical protein ACFL08_00905 [Patescibacteria group bacterium]